MARRRAAVGASGPAVRREPVATASEAPRPALPAEAPVERGELLRRILRALERETLAVADRLAGDGPVDCIACDKAAKNLNLLVRTIEKLDTIEEARPTDDDDAHLDALRTELARRVRRARPGGGA